MRKGKAMKKIHIIFVLTVLLLGSIRNTYAQGGIFIMEGEEDHFDDRIGTATPGFNFPGIMPQHDSTLDWTPVGNGIWLLGCLGGAYLLGKRKKKEDE
jgi:hypothetical protein